MTRRHAIVMTLALALVISPAQGQTVAPAVARQYNKYVACWNDAVDSMNREQPLLEELNQSLHESPPYRAVSARRRELIKLIRAERVKQDADFKCMEALEGRP